MLRLRRLIAAYPTVWRRSVSPILVRPVREQLEHDRIIRLLQAKFRRKYEAGMNPGRAERCRSGRARRPLSRPRAAVAGPRPQAAGRGRGRDRRVGQPPRSAGAVGAFRRSCARRFISTCPAGMVDVARRLCEDNQIHVAEIWSYHVVGDEVRFTLVHRSREAPRRSRAVRREAGRAKPAAAPRREAGRVAKPAKPREACEAAPSREQAEAASPSRRPPSRRRPRVKKKKK